MGMSPLIFILICLIKPWSTVGKVYNIPIPVDSPSNEYHCKSSCLSQPLLKDKRATHEVYLKNPRRNTNPKFDFRPQSGDLGAIVAGLKVSPYNDKKYFGQSSSSLLNGGLINPSRLDLSALDWPFWMTNRPACNPGNKNSRKDVWYKNVNSPIKYDLFNLNNVYKRAVDKKLKYYISNEDSSYSKPRNNQKIENQAAFNVYSVYPGQWTSANTGDRIDMEEIEARLLMKPYDIELSKPSVTMTGVKRSLETEYPYNNHVKKRMPDSNISGPLPKYAPSLDISARNGLDDIEERMLSYPNVIEFSRSNDGLGEISARFLDLDDSSEVSTIPEDMHLNSLPVGGRMDHLPLEADDNNGQSTSNPITEVQGRIDGFNEMESISNKRHVPASEENKDIPEVNAEGRMDMITDVNPILFAGEEMNQPIFNMDIKVHDTIPTLGVDDLLPHPSLFSIEQSSESELDNLKLGVEGRNFPTPDETLLNDPVANKVAMDSVPLLIAGRMDGSISDTANKSDYVQDRIVDSRTDVEAGSIVSGTEKSSPTAFTADPELVSHSGKDITSHFVEGD